MQAVRQGVFALMKNWEVKGGKTWCDKISKQASSINIEKNKRALHLICCIHYVTI